MEKSVKETIVVEKHPGMTKESLEYLRSGAAWAQFLAIVSFVFCGLAILGSIMMFIMALVMPSSFCSGLNQGMLGSLQCAFMGGAMFISAIYLVFGILGFIMAYFLYTFAVDSKRAVLSGDTALLTKGMHAIKKYFKFSGILAIITIVFTLFWVPFAFMMMPGM